MECRPQAKLPEIKRVPPLSLSCSDSKSPVDGVWIPALTLNNHAVFWQITWTVMLSLLICEMGRATSNVWSVARLCIKQPRALQITWVQILVRYTLALRLWKNHLSSVCPSVSSSEKWAEKSAYLIWLSYQWVGWWWTVWPLKRDHLDVNFSSVFPHLCDLGRFIHPFCASVLTSLKWESCEVTSCRITHGRANLCCED